MFGIARGKDSNEYGRALKPVRDFAKKLLGRLVFLHFLQKKGWLGCPANGRIGLAAIRTLLQTCSMPHRTSSTFIASAWFRCSSTR